MSKIRILVIDDNEDDWQLYRRALNDHADASYIIFEVPDGEEGLKFIPEHHPDCILLDYSLPGRNGIEVLKRIRSNYPFIPVVMLTGQGNENVAVTAIKEGAQDYIAKSSITEDSLQRLVRVSIEYCALQKRIREQQLSLEIFSRALAHDLKEPVNTIRSFLDLVTMHETLSARGEGYLDYVKNAADRMSALIDAVYFYTRLDGSQQELTKEQCDIVSLFEDVKANLSSLIQERNVIITCGQLPMVYANRVQLTQVLQNLITNAIHHCQADPVIQIRVSEEKQQWTVSVTDNGPGVAEEHREKIFEPFKRMARHNSGQGLGLGLSICKKIVESHGGKIWCEFAPDIDTTFLFTLPKPTVPEGNSRAKAALKERLEHVLNEPLASILLVEDSEADIELTRVMLIGEAQLRCNLLVANDAFEALTMMHAEIEKTGSIDLLLLDINMPGMDGFELIERMHADAKLQQVPVVICSSSNYYKDMERAKLLGAKGYLVKPAELKNLRPVLDVIDTLQLHQEAEGFSLLRVA